ncbi:Salivary glue protein Sgs-4 [Halotydeus destructor]|nr:Salivary glue protein Sgs-4 [Halotydeus destructor]
MDHPAISPPIFMVKNLARKFSLTRRVTEFRIRSDGVEPPPMSLFQTSSNAGDNPKLQQILQKIQKNVRQRSRPRQWEMQDSPEINLPSSSDEDSSIEEDNLAVELVEQPRRVSTPKAELPILSSSSSSDESSEEEDVFSAEEMPAPSQRTSTPRAAKSAPARPSPACSVISSNSGKKKLHQSQRSTSTVSKSSFRSKATNRRSIASIRNRMSPVERGRKSVIPEHLQESVFALSPFASPMLIDDRPVNYVGKEMAMSESRSTEPDQLIGETGPSLDEPDQMAVENDVPVAQIISKETGFPVAETEESVAEPPVDDDEPSITEAEPPLIVAAASVAKNEASVAKDEASVAQNEASIAQNEASVAENEASIAQNEASVAGNEASVAENEASVARNEASVAENVAPVAEAEPPVDDDEPPVAEAEPSVAEAEPSVAEAEPSVAEAEPSVAEAEPSVAEAEPSVAEAEPSVAEDEPSVAEAEPSVAEAELSVVEAEPLVAEDEPPVAEAEAPLFVAEASVDDDEQLVAEAEASVAKHGQPVDESGPSIGEPDMLPNVPDPLMEKLDQAEPKVKVRKVVRKAPTLMGLDIEQRHNMTPNLIEPEETGGLRRSRRTRVQKLDFWMNQRPIYKRDSTGLAFRIVGVQKGSTVPSPKRTKKKAPPKRKHLETEQIERVVKRSALDLSIHASNIDTMLRENDKRKKRAIKSGFKVSGLANLTWKPSSVAEGVEIAIKTKRSGYAEGVIRLLPLAHKASQRTAEYMTSFTVAHGVVQVRIEGEPEFMVKTLETIELPPNTLYEMVNLRSDEAYVSFIVNKAS